MRRAYFEQMEAIQGLGGRLILMASRALARAAQGPEDYAALYGELLAAADSPVVLHGLGEMFDPALKGYWGADRFEDALDVVVGIIAANPAKVDGIKISLLDKDKEIALRRRLPAGVKMYTGDDFNYPELIEGDGEGFSHALLGVFDPLAPAAAFAIGRLGQGDAAGFRATLDPNVPLAREIFRAPTRFYKAGIAFLSWINGLQRHFLMPAGFQSSRDITHYAAVYRLADHAGLLSRPDLAEARMKTLLALHGIDQT